MDTLKRREGDAFQIRSKAAKSKASAAGPSESKEEESLTGFSLALFGLCDVVETLVRARLTERLMERRAEGPRGPSAAPAAGPAAATRASKEFLGGSAAFAAATQDEDEDDEDWREHVQYLHCMITSGERGVRLKAAMTLGILAQHRYAGAPRVSHTLYPTPHAHQPPAAYASPYSCFAAISPCCKPRSLHLPAVTVACTRA